MDSLRKLWDSIPGPLRTLINIGLGAALTAATQYLFTLARPGDFNLNTAVDVVWLAVSTAIVRALNPADTAYGVGKMIEAKQTPDGAHEITDLPPAEETYDPADLPDDTPPGLT